MSKEEYCPYPETVQDWLSKWDSGQSVFSVEMGGLGPGYEQAIHVAAAEIMRALLSLDIDKDRFKSDEEYNRSCWESVDGSDGVSAVMDRLHLSGAQFGAAKNVAAVFLLKGPRVALSDKAVKDRKIQVSKGFPQ